MTSYIALLFKEKKSDYGVTFPDFPGCITAGKTLEEARRFAAEALNLHIETMQDDGDTLPEPSSLDAVMEDPDCQNAVVFLVDAKVERTKAIRVNVTIKENVLSQLDALVAALNTSRAAVLEEAVIARLKIAGVSNVKRRPRNRRDIVRNRKRVAAGRKKATRKGA